MPRHAYGGLPSPCVGSQENCGERLEKRCQTLPAAFHGSRSGRYDFIMNITEQEPERDNEQPDLRPERTRGRPFAKGQSGNPGGKNRKGGQKPSGLLRDMRFVYGTAETQAGDKTQGRRECRAWLKEDRKGFLSKMADLEKAAAGGRGAAKEAGEKTANAPDEGTERVMELIDRLLAEWKQTAEDVNR